MKDIVQIAGHQFNTLVAVTADEQSTGLMYKKWPPPVMCFPFVSAGIHKFWMKNTISPLDIVFCRDNKIISICYGEPMSSKLVGPDSPCDLVVELPHGTVQNYKIGIGDEVRLSNSSQTVAKDIRNIIQKILK